MMFSYLISFILVIGSMLIVAPLAAFVYLTSDERKRKRKSWLVLLTPFVFFFTLCPGLWLGAKAVSYTAGGKLSSDGQWCTALPNGYRFCSRDLESEGEIRKKDTLIISAVEELKEEGDLVMGKISKQSPVLENAYFSLDTRSGELKIYNDYAQTAGVFPDVTAGLSGVMNFGLRKVQGWIIAILALSLLAACGMVYALARALSFRENRKEEDSPDKKAAGRFDL